MSIAIATGMVAAVAVANMGSTETSHAGPVIWQGIVLVMFLPFLAALYLSWQQVPLFEDTPELKQKARWWRRVMVGLVIAYVVLAAILMVVIMKLGI
jgi:hypothetical protein